MKFIYASLIALGGIKANKGRSILTILGIVIGITSVIAMLSIGQGAENLIISQLNTLGSNNIFIEPGAWSERMERGQMMQSMMEEFEIKTLKYEDAFAIAGIPGVEAAAPFVMGVARVVYGPDSKKVTFFGTTPETAQITGIEAVLGRNLEEADIKAMARVAVLGHKTRQDLFGEENPIGQTLRIKKTNFKVIGLLEEVGPQAMMDIDQGLFLPLTTAQKLLLGIDYIRFIMAKAENEEIIDRVIYDMRQVLRERHNIYNPEGDTAKDDFKIMSQQETVEILGNITGIFTALLSMIAAISLIVGGIGIMNIMLVSVVERTREVGLRKAVGAKKTDILTQFLLEAIFLTFSGGILGIIFGALLSWAASLAFGYFLGSSWGFLLPLSAVVLGVGVSVTIGLIFGFYPALRAARLNPIDALRYE